MKREKLLTRSLILILLSAIFTGMVQNQPLMVAASTSEFFEGFENGTGNWLGIEEPIGTSFTTSTLYKKENSHSGKQGGGGGNIYRTDLWDAPGSFEEGILEGWIYGSHYNHYTKSLIHVLYEEDNNRCGISFYRDSVAVFAVVAGTWYMLGTISLGQSWNNHWWWYNITLENGSPDVISVEIKKEGSSVLTGGPYSITQGNLGYGHVVFKSRVGSYGNHYHDAVKLEVIKPDYFEEDFENGIGDWMTYNPPDDTYLQQSSSFVKEGSYSGKQGGGSGSIFRSDRWDAPGTNREGILEGWTYCYHHNFYSSEYIYILYFDDNNNYGFRFYRDHVLLFATINGNVEDLGTISLGEGWNFKWWWFKITLYNGEGIFNDHLRLEIQKDGGSKHVISGDVSMGNLNSGHVVLCSRVGYYGKHYFDRLSFTVDPYQIPTPESIEVTRHSPVANNTEDVLLHWKIDSAGAYENESIVVIKDQDQVVVDMRYMDDNMLVAKVPYDTTYYFDVYTRHVDGDLVSEWVKAPEISVYNPEFREDPVIYRPDVALFYGHNVNTSFIMNGVQNVINDIYDFFYGTINYVMKVHIIRWDGNPRIDGSLYDIAVAISFYINSSRETFWGTKTHLCATQVGIVAEWDNQEGKCLPQYETVNHDYNPTSNLTSITGSQITPEYGTSEPISLDAVATEILTDSMTIFNGIMTFVDVFNPLDMFLDLQDASDTAIKWIKLTGLLGPDPTDEDYYFTFQSDFLGDFGRGLDPETRFDLGSVYARFKWQPEVDISHITFRPFFTVNDYLSGGDRPQLLSTMEVNGTTLTLQAARNDNVDDIDRDGLPDGWESTYGDADQDPDNDGYDNLREYVQNTDPNEKNTDTVTVLSSSKANQLGVVLDQAEYYLYTNLSVLRDGEYTFKFYHQAVYTSGSISNWMFLSPSYTWFLQSSWHSIEASYYGINKCWWLVITDVEIMKFRIEVYDASNYLVDERIITVYIVV
ncbi:MAG: hypothetical protein ACXADA_24375 [Candidatus Hodarchaeales archaeon]